MKIVIQGQDYSAALDASRPLTIARTLNEPSACTLALSLPQRSALAAPARFQQLTVTGDNGQIYFTGYIAATPMPEFAGLAMEGPRYRYLVEAVSDEILLDQALMAPVKGATGLAAGALLATLATHTGSAALNTSALTLAAPVGSFAPEPGAPFSKSAGQVAGQVRAAYRAQGGALTLTAIPGAVHPLNETDGSLTLQNLALTAGVKRTLANDFTVCGENEPVAYVTEYFLGDGTTTQFFLAEDPWCPPAGKANVIAELFNEPAINTAVWGNPSGSNYFTLGAGGLQMNGGSGVDGQTQLAWLDPVEMGGTLLLEAQGVTLANASTGLLASFFSGPQSIAGCMAGFRVAAQPGTGAVTVQPIVYGAGSGATFPVNAANRYNLRIRVHCPECLRTQATYIAFGDSGAITTGGQTTLGQGKIQFEIQEIVNGVAAMPVTLYDGAVGGLPAACSVVAASSLNLHGSMRALHLTNLGSGWVVSTPAGGGPYTRRVGTAAQSAECHVERTGKLAFYTGFVPVAGEQLAVSYRTQGRAVGRQENAASQQAMGTAAWIGTVTSPPARCSADCRSAASALAQEAASASAMWAGTYRGTSFDFAADVWPGDALELNAPSCGLNAQVVVRGVKLSYQASVPDLVQYEVAFANDWADDLAIRTSAAVPANTWLPAQAGLTPAANLNALTVTAIGGATVTVNTGTAPPAGGGFEVRTRDFCFMPGEDPGLVLRGAQQNLTWQRVSAADRFYVRMFDGASPPNYSEFSAAVFVNVPLAQ
ncbi:MAG TPA: hypothetical protein VG267_14115 [Terracidiphilus sp.]|jgi:hypothetical protein|nr:hypothetical protein [Terracidiphilus sp.]